MRRQASSLRAAWTTTRGRNPTGSPSPGTAWIASGTSPSAPTPRTRACTPTTWPPPPSAASATPSTVRRRGTKLLPTADATCAGCHTGGTAITAKIITWGALNPNWRAGRRPARVGVRRRGPHNDSLDTLYEDGEWDGVSTPPPSSELSRRSVRALRLRHPPLPRDQPARRQQLEVQDLRGQAAVQRQPPRTTTRSIRSWSPRTAPAPTAASTPSMTTWAPPTRRSQRFVDANPGIMRCPAATSGRVNTDGDDVALPNANETHALVAGLTCGRPSNPATGEDECHAEAAYAIVDKGIKENRNHGTKISRQRRQPARLSQHHPGPGQRKQQLLPHRQHRRRGPWLRRQRQPRLEDRPRRRFVRSGSGRRLLRADRRLHELPRPDRLGQHRRGQLHVPARPDPGRYHERHGRRRRHRHDGPLPHLVRLERRHPRRPRTVTDSTTKAFDGQCLKCHRDGARQRYRPDQVARRSSTKVDLDLVRKGAGSLREPAPCLLRRIYTRAVGSEACCERTVSSRRQRGRGRACSTTHRSSR